MKQYESPNGNEKYLPEKTAGVKQRHVIRGILTILVILLGIAWLVIDDEEAVQSEEGSSFVKLKEKSNDFSKDLCPLFCKARLQQRRKHHGGDFLKVKDMIEQLQSAKTKLVDEMKIHYGEYYDAMWMKNGKWRQGFSGINENGISTARFRRKLKMKILEVQAAVRNENEDLEGCNCNQGSHRRLEPHATIVLPDLQQTYSKFVWATGGNSIAAGHGNMQNETYTAFLERAAKPIFEAIGIAFDGRNYAMGGILSSPEIALCQESIFGIDADVLTYAFALTDNPRYYKQSHYVSRAGVHRNRPAIVAINIQKYGIDARKDILGKAEDHGLTTFYMLDETIKDMQAMLPDMLGMNQAQIDAVPEYVRYFKCKDLLEKSEPGCGDNRYNPTCVDRRHQVSWHPGWKTNALHGNLMAFHLIENLEGALEELASEVYDPAVKLAELKRDEDDDYDRFHNDYVVPWEPTPGFVEENIVSDIDPNWLHFAPLFCHTALLPSELRYRRAFETGSPGYYNSISFEEANRTSSSQGGMRLVTLREDYHNPCPALTNIDYKDFLYTNENDGWSHVLLPSDLEIEEYGTLKSPKGIIIMCFFPCPWNLCVDGDVRPEDLEKKLLKVKVNGERVTKLLEVGECHIAKHKNGFFFNHQEGRFKVEVLVAKPATGQRNYTSSTRITSIIAV